MKFSDRIGITQQRNVIQRDGIDDILKNKLWNIFYTYILLPLQNENTNLLVNSGHFRFFINLWHNYFEKPVDTIPEEVTSAITNLRSYFFECKWFDIYNIIEFVSTENELFENDKFKDSINIVLETELSAYRFIGGEIVMVEKGEKVSEVEKLETDNEKRITESEAKVIEPEREKEIKKTITTEFMISAIEPYRIEDQLNFLPEEKKNVSADVNESTKSVKAKLGLRSEDREAFLTIKSKPARTTVDSKNGKDGVNKSDPSEVISGHSNQSTHQGTNSENAKEEASEKKDELDKAIQILRQKKDTKLNLNDH